MLSDIFGRISVYLSYFKLIKTGMNGEASALSIIIGLC